MSATKSILLRVDDVSKSYQTGDRRLEVLKRVSLEVAAGEVVAIIGESGSGKSTLLHVLGTLDRPDSGTVLFNGENVFTRSDEELAAFRNREIGFVFQFHHLLPEFSAVENVAMPALIQRAPLADAKKRAASLLRRMNLGDRLEHRPSQLSGGEQQRVAVARALMNQPELVLADEPTGNLDHATAELLHAHLFSLSREFGQAFVVVTHNATLASHADRVLELVEGTLQPRRQPRAT